MENQTKEILDELKQIRIDIEIVKNNMPDKDMFLDAGEECLLEESFENEEKGTLVSSDKLKIELGI
tara:strand:+ start:185 stop:382 length:198 start_codon:yes stop_codon:yes gene_type:complete